MSAREGHRRADEPRPRARGPGSGWRVLWLVGVAYAAVLVAIVGVRACSTSDFRDFWENAVHLRETGQIATDLGVHNYLPFFTIFMLPWGLLPLAWAAGLFALLSLALFAVAVALTEHLLCDGWPATPRPAMLAAMGLMLPYVHSCAVLGNVGLLLAFLIVAAWLLVERGREWEAGVAIGLAALIKLLPAVLLVYFALRRRWRVPAAGLGTMVVLGLGLPLVMLGPARAYASHRAFYEQAVRGGSPAATILAEQPRKANYSNSSLPIVLRRLLSPVGGGKDGRPLRVNVADVPRPVILSLYIAVLAGIVFLTAGAAWRGPRAWPPTSPIDGWRLRGEYGSWCCVVLLAAPLVWTHYLPLLYWPLALVSHRVFGARGGMPVGAGARKDSRTGPFPRIALACWLVAAVLLSLPAARAAGAQLWAVAILWLACTLPLVSRSAGRPSQ